MLFPKNRKFWRLSFLTDKFCCCGITFSGAILHKGKFIFLKSAKNKEFFSTGTYHDLFLEKKFPTLLRGFFDFLGYKNAFALGITQNIKNRFF